MSGAVAPDVVLAPAVHTDEDEVMQGRDLHAIFRLWDEKHSTPQYDPVRILTR